jgi:DNA-damage-inducible protein D
MTSKKQQKIALFEGKQIRRHWDEEKELWYFAVSDVIAVLTNSVNPLAYWRKLKEHLSKEGGNETVT